MGPEDGYRANTIHICLCNDKLDAALSFSQGFAKDSTETVFLRRPEMAVVQRCYDVIRTERFLHGARRRVGKTFMKR